MPEKQQKTLMPPYLTLAGMDKLFSLVSGRRLESITSEYLKAYGFGQSDTSIAIATLRFLGFVDEEGKTQPDIKVLFLQGDARKTALQPIVRKAYAPVFNRIEDPSALSQQELMNEFITLYDLSPRVARPAVLAFQWLSEKAGLRDETLAPRKRNSTGSAKKSVQSVKTGVASMRSPSGRSMDDQRNVHRYPFPGGITIEIPQTENITDIVLSDEFRQASDLLKAISLKHFSSQEPPVQETAV